MVVGNGLRFYCVGYATCSRVAPRRESCRGATRLQEQPFGECCRLTDPFSCGVAQIPDRCLVDAVPLAAGGDTDSLIVVDITLFCGPFEQPRPFMAMHWLGREAPGGLQQLPDVDLPQLTARCGCRSSKIRVVLHAVRDHHERGFKHARARWSSAEPGARSVRRQSNAGTNRAESARERSSRVRARAVGQIGQWNPGRRPWGSASASRPV